MRCNSDAAIEAGTHGSGAEERKKNVQRKLDSLRRFMTLQRLYQHSSDGFARRCSSYQHDLNEDITSLKEPGHLESSLRRAIRPS